MKYHDKITSAKNFEIAFLGFLIFIKNDGFTHYSTPMPPFNIFFAAFITRGCGILRPKLRQ